MIETIAEEFDIEEVEVMELENEIEEFEHKENLKELINMIDEIKNEMPNSQALGAFNESIGSSSISAGENSSNRLKILENSLEKKEAELQNSFDNHFNTWKQANGQPMNDKRNGVAFSNKIEQQNNTIRNKQAGIEKTKNAIEIEKSKISNVNSVKVPKKIKILLDTKQLTQWRKYPNRFFVTGVEKARIILDEKTGKFSAQYYKQIPNQEKYTKFRDIFNSLNKK